MAIILRDIGVNMKFMIEFHNVKSAFIDIEVDVPFLKIGGAGLPYGCFRMQCFDSLPCTVSDALLFYRISANNQEELCLFVVRMDALSRKRQRRMSFMP